MESKNWSVHVEFAVIFVTMLGGYYLINQQIQAQSARTDRLYEMFIDLLKENK